MRNPLATKTAKAPTVTSTAQRKRMLIIVNPHATTVSARLKRLVVYALKGCYEVEAVTTEEPDHATELCRQAAQTGVDIVVSLGGDGTANEVANGLAGTDVPMMCLPGGSANVYCRMLGIPADVVDATEYLLEIAEHWQIRRVDLGQVNGRYFLFSSGVGLDASVVEEVDRHPRLKAYLRHSWFAYVSAATFISLYTKNPPQLQVNFNGERLEGVTAIIQNGSPYSYFYNRPLHVAQAANLQSGTLSGAVLTRAKIRDMPTIGLRALSGKLQLINHRHIKSFSAQSEVTVITPDQHPFPIQVDGDYIGQATEANYRL
jgi:diacylglycerol kinase family enzyme